MNRRDFLVRSSTALSVGWFVRSSLYGQATKSAPATRAPAVTEFKELRRNVGTFTGRGGTIGWLSNHDALVAVDTQFADTASAFLAGLPGREGRKLDAVIDTHHHWDHTAGNKTFQPAAKMIVAHENVPKLQARAFERDANREPTFPDTLFAEAWRKDVGDEIVTAQYFGAAHTGGDIVVHFERANVIHVGDLVFNRLYPVTDRPGGCSVGGWIKVLDEVLRVYPSDAVYIFGHGKPQFGITGTRDNVETMREFLSALLVHVETARKQGKSKAEIVTLANLPGWDEWHAQPGAGNRLPMNLGAVYDELDGASP